ncbi:S-adenosyl-L-methionine-dependent methyltransferase [Exidia glandulosa HHB12029]|uniref:S-adenosyl-L-methionine-dependent methyltransferase n=1 Tax=Exidia glandulosa HHB12029 TaxID=1314781 RepID=A0A165FYK7_EXIGL|nr:S-adenosyl-L-methionine-dependent methyltransferase [Exidia glandulosa HHB12029]
MASVPTMQQLVAEHGEGAWEKTWSIGRTPWEVQTGYQPALKDFLERNKPDLPQSGRAIVPGCGRGYDAILIGETLGLNVLGVDLSETGISAAKELLAKTGTTAAVSYQAGDFFKFALAPDAERFVLAYDFTFFVAMPPELRVSWGAQMNDLLVPGAALVTLVWPLGPASRVGGPPHSVSVQAYADVLGSAFAKVYDEPAVGTMDGRVEGAESRLVVWRKAAT